MVTRNRLHVGCRVVGCYGPLITNPNGRGKRRIRTRVVGTVVKAVDQHKWAVVFDYDGKSRMCKSNSLVVVDDEVGIPLHENEAEATAISNDEDSRSIVANALLMVSDSFELFG